MRRSRYRASVLVLLLLWWLLLLLVLFTRSACIAVMHPPLYGMCLIHTA